MELRKIILKEMGDLEWMKDIPAEQRKLQCSEMKVGLRVQLGKKTVKDLSQKDRFVGTVIQVGFESLEDPEENNPNSMLIMFDHVGSGHNGGFKPITTGKYTCKGNCWWVNCDDDSEYDLLVWNHQKQR